MKKKHYLVYKTTNLVNGKIYIGKHETYNLDDGYLGSGKLLKKAIEKYGEENFKREILFECSSVDEMNAKEAELVNEEFLKRDDVYNLKQGGDGGFDYINTHGLWGDTSKGGQAFAKKLKEDENFRRKISDGLRRYHHEHPEHCITMYNATKNKKPWLGKHLLKDVRCKIGRTNSQRLKGEHNPNYGKHWVSDTFNELCYPLDKTLPLEDYQIPMRILDFDEYRLEKSNRQMLEITNQEHQQKLQEIQQTFFSEFYNEYLKNGFDSMCNRFGLEFEISAFLHLCKKRVPQYGTWKRARRMQKQ